jgi:carbonic anhydrase
MRLTFLISLWQALAYAAETSDKKWVYGYEGATSADPAAQAAWGGLCASGQEQSPINVVTHAAVKTTMPVIATYMHTAALVSDGLNSSIHGGVRIDRYTADVLVGSSSDRGYSMIAGSKYNFYQVQWHTPSENTIDGQSFAMEAQFVHQLDDVALRGTYHRLAVIALMLELGTEHQCTSRKSLLDGFWATFPDAKGVAEYASQTPNFNQKLHEELAQGYYHWYGSLTTPPCTEGVSWNLAKARGKVCQQQVDKLREALATTQERVGFNNRLAQPMNHRAVAVMEGGNPRAPGYNSAVLPVGASQWRYAALGDTVADDVVQKDTWGGLCATGHEQSPINVVTTEVVRAALPRRLVTSLDTKVSYLANKGHGFQLFETHPHRHAFLAGEVSPVNTGASAKGFSMMGGDKYNFYEVHWHTPSENTIDGESFAMEANFIHQLDDASLQGTFHRFAVIALLYELGSDSECNRVLNQFWAQFPDHKGYVTYRGENPDFNQNLNEEILHGYYHWMGSLSVPPCTEGVSWNLLKVQEKVCQAQVDKLAMALSTTQAGIAFNNRATQPLYHRIVTEMAWVAILDTFSEQKQMLSVDMHSSRATHACGFRSISMVTMLILRIMTMRV